MKIFENFCCNIFNLSLIPDVYFRNQIMGGLILLVKWCKTQVRHHASRRKSISFMVDDMMILITTTLNGRIIMDHSLIAKYVIIAGIINRLNKKKLNNILNVLKYFFFLYSLILYLPLITNIRIMRSSI